MQLLEERGQLEEWALEKGADGLARYRADRNRVSLDGLPGLPASPE